MTDEPSFEFFSDAGSCSLAVRIILEEGRFNYKANNVSARDDDRETRRPEWLTRNPKGRVPALSPVSGRSSGEELLLTEVPAILTYLARLRPALDLVPADPAREARTLEWMNWLSGWLHAVAFAQLWRPERFSNDPEMFDAIRLKGRENLLDAFVTIERTFADGRIWAVPDAYTVVDAFLIVFYRWASSLGVQMADYPHWNASCLRTTERPAVAAAFDHDGLYKFWL